MIEIVFYTAATFILTFIFGSGLTLLILPSTMRRYALWLTPWILIIFLIFTLTTFSIFGLSVKTVSPFIIVSLLLLNIYVIFKTKLKYIFALKKDTLLLLFVITSITLNLSPLLRRHQFLTTVSMGNNDPIVYAGSSDFLVNHSIRDNFFMTTQDYIGGLLVTSYRWGSPIIESFFLNIFDLKGYQYTYAFEVILYGLMIPMAYILLQIIYKEKSLLALIFLSLLLVFNANMLYIVYHDFFGQVLFWGLGLTLLIFIYSYLDKPSLLINGINIYDILIAFSLSALYMSYHEPVIFILGPLFIYIFFLFALKKQAKKTLHGIMKIGLVTFLLSSSVIVTATVNDFLQALRVDPNAVIGWQLFRQSVPFANPVEMIGFSSIHNFPPIPVFYAVILSLLVIGIIIYGFIQSKQKLLTFSYIILIVLFLVWLLNNFFAYNRALTYNLPLILILFTIGVAEIIEKNKKTIYFFAVVFIMVVVSGILLNKRFLREHAAITKNFISLKNLPANAKHEAIYIEQDINGTMPLWKIIWTSYFIYPEITENLPTKKSVTNRYANSVPDNALILIEKPTAWYVPTKVVLKKVIWENEYYVLGRLCNNEECLIDKSFDLSQVNFSPSDYEDSILLIGWSTKESGHRWINNKIATFRLVADKPVSNLKMEALSLQKPQSLKVFVNDEFIEEVAIDTSWNEYDFYIGNHENEVVNFQLEFSNLYNPNSLGISADPRDLAVDIKKISLE